MTRSLSGKKDDSTELRQSRSCADRCCRFVCLVANSSVSITLIALPSHTYCCFRPPLLLPTGRSSRPSGVWPDFYRKMQVGCCEAVTTVLIIRARTPAYAPRSLICFLDDYWQGLVCSSQLQQTTNRRVFSLWACHVTRQPEVKTIRRRVPRWACEIPALQAGWIRYN